MLESEFSQRLAGEISRLNSQEPEFGQNVLKFKARQQKLATFAQKLIPDLEPEGYVLLAFNEVADLTANIDPGDQRWGNVNNKSLLIGTYLVDFDQIGKQIYGPDFIKKAKEFRKAVFKEPAKKDIG